jgi:hypothetical protein
MSNGMARVALLALGLAVILGFNSVAERTAHAAGNNVGYYEMGSGGGVANQVPPITTAGETPILLGGLADFDLAGIDILFINNPSNGDYDAEFLNNVDAIAAWVEAGGKLVFHDRWVDPAETVLPGGATFEIVRDTDEPEDAEIEVIDDTTLVTDGPGGVLDDTSLDGGTSSSHGYAVLGSLPSNGTFILSRTSETEIVTFSYCFGDGGVLFSSIPLDFYLAGDGPAEVNANMQIYAANVIAYSAQELCSQAAPRLPIQPERPRTNVAGGIAGIFTPSQALVPAGSAPGSSAGSAPISPPSTGAGVTITPPSTGDAGLAGRDGAPVVGLLAAVAVGFAVLGLKARKHRA